MIKKLFRVEIEFDYKDNENTPEERAALHRELRAVHKDAWVRSGEQEDVELRRRPSVNCLIEDGDAERIERRFFVILGSRLSRSDRFKQIRLEMSWIENEVSVFSSNEVPDDGDTNLDCYDPEYLCVCIELVRLHIARIEECIGEQQEKGQQ